MSALTAAWAAQRARWNDAWGRFAARSLREQLLLVGVVLVLVFWVSDALWLTPALQARKQALAREASERQALQQAQAALLASAQDIAARRSQRQAELEGLRQQRTALEQSQPMAAKADAAHTLALIESLVQRQAQAAPGGGLQLVALRSLPDLGPPAAPAAEASAPGGTGAPHLYRHGVQVVLSGRYEALQAYVQALARVQDTPLRLRSLSLVVQSHPTLELTVDLETLSPDPAWLAL
jgi:MSHA biogenesis protein MshJ